MYGLLDVSASGMIAQRTRLTVATANLANMHTLTGPDGSYEPYRPRSVVLGVGDPERNNSQGVHVADIAISDAPLTPKYEPGNKFADSDGFVGYPDIHPEIELVNAMEATRAYEANVAAAEATKTLVTLALSLLT